MDPGNQIKPKRIHVFVNGNPSERIFFIHPKSLLNWSSVVSFIGNLLKPQNGPVKVIRKPDGSSVTSYEELQDNGKYIACGREALIPLRDGYRTESEIEFQKDLRESSSSEILRAIGQSMSYLTDTNQLDIITVYVFVNGQKRKPTKISLLNTDLKQWSIVFCILSKQMNFPIKQLYTIFGEKVKNPSDIQHRGFYVGLEEGTTFCDISYLSVFSSTRQRKTRFKQTTQQTYTKENKVFPENIDWNSAADSRNLTKHSANIPGPLAVSLHNSTDTVCKNKGVIHVNNPTAESPCLHVTIIQRPFSATKHLPGVPATVCATRPSAKLILEMMGEEGFNTKCQTCKSTQTNNIFCESIPKGKCVIEVSSKKFHIISDEDTIVLPCGTYFSSRKSMNKLCTFPLGNESLSLENIANHIVGIIVDTSEYCINRAIHGSEDPVLGLEAKAAMEGDKFEDCESMEKPKANKKDNAIECVNRLV